VISKWEALAIIKSLVLIVFAISELMNSKTAKPGG